MDSSFLLFIIPHKFSSRIVPQAESNIDLGGFSKLDISLLGIFIVAGYTFLDGLSDLIVEVYYYIQKKLSNSYDQIILFNPKLFLSSLLKTILGYVVLFYHKTIYKYINDWDQNINHK